MADAFLPYAPLNILKPVAENLWLADGPEIVMRYLGLGMPFPTRMTVVRLADGGLFVHSPVAPDAALMDAVAALGPVRHLVAPNSLHYWWMPDWKARFPGARVHAVPGLARTARRRLAVDAELGDRPPPDWADELDQVLVKGRMLTEADFFHRPSRTAILTDLIENFETGRVTNRWLRGLIRMSHAADPHGSAPYDMRLTFLGRRRAMRPAVRRMLAWNAVRVILAHGRWYPANGAAELRRAFGWVGA